jgi:hypothetical protein
VCFLKKYHHSPYSTAARKIIAHNFFIRLFYAKLKYKQAASAFRVNEEIECNFAAIKKKKCY